MSITPEMVIDAYRETKLIPHQRFFKYESSSGCWACGVGALVIQQQPNMRYSGSMKDSSDWFPVLMEKLDVTRPYLFGFVQGFDGYEQALSREVFAEKYSDEEYADVLRGFEDGRAVWERVEEELIK